MQKHCIQRHVRKRNLSTQLISKGPQDQKPDDFTPLLKAH